MKWLGIAFVVVAVGVILYKISYPSYSYRYRMTVNVEVDGQIRSSSSVIEARVSKQPVFLPGVNPLQYSERGEAVFVDLGGQNNIVALWRQAHTRNVLLILHSWCLRISSSIVR